MPIISSKDARGRFVEIESRKSPVLASKRQEPITAWIPKGEGRAYPEQKADAFNPI